MLLAHPVLVDDVYDGCKLSLVRSILKDGDAPDLHELMERLQEKEITLSKTNTNDVGKSAEIRSGTQNLQKKVKNSQFLTMIGSWSLWKRKEPSS